MSGGLHTRKVNSSKIPFNEIVSEILGAPVGNFSVSRFCDDAEGELRQYNVYKVELNGRVYVLKNSSKEEVFVYEKLLNGKNLPVPEFFGKAVRGGKTWILIEYIEGADLRDFTDGAARAAAESITAVMKTYWQNSAEEFESKRVDDRFARYWERVNKRAQCLKNESLLSAAYKVFLERQQSCPRTLSNGDFLQYNAIFQGGKVFIIDWAFAGIMPYSLDIARLIAHGTPDRATFPFFMTYGHKKTYVEEVYKNLPVQIEFKRYEQDIKLSLLNEYIEFIEYYLNNPEEERPQFFNYYYEHALKLTDEILGQ